MLYHGEHLLKGCNVQLLCSLLIPRPSLIHINFLVVFAVIIDVAKDDGSRDRTVSVSTTKLQEEVLKREETRKHRQILIV